MALFHVSPFRIPNDLKLLNVQEVRNTGHPRREEVSTIVEVTFKSTFD